MATGTQGPAAREAYWDIVKGLLIILVVAGHAVQYCCNGNFWGHPVFKGIYLFHMPLFVLVSGYFAHGSIRRHGWLYPLRNVRHLLLPAATAGLVFIATHNAWPEYFNNYTDWYPLLLGIWFLYAIFEYGLFLCILESLRSMLWRVLWIAAPMLLALLWEGLPFRNQFTFLYPFFLLGAWVAARRPNLAHPAIGLAALAVYAAVFCCFDDTWYVYRKPWVALDAPAEIYNIYAIRTLGALAGCFLFLFAAKRLERWLNRRLLLRLGSATMAVYILQAYFWDFAKVERIMQVNTAAAMAIAAALLALCYGLYRLMAKSRLLALINFGKYARTPKV